MRALRVACSQRNYWGDVLVGGRVLVCIPSDVSSDRKIDIAQGTSFLAAPSSLKLEPKADINGNGIVNILDAVIL
jgi:hypothetical protein